jgi:hypothetical protein
MQQTQIEWTTLEHKHIHKSSDWFWALGILAITAAATSIIFNNILFAIVILIGAFTMGMNASKPPAQARFKITQRGILINNTLYPYSSLESFWVADENEYEQPKLLVKSKKLLTPHIVIPIESASPDDIRDYILNYLDEEEDSESLIQKIMEFFGF